MVARGLVEVEKIDRILSSREGRRHLALATFSFLTMTPSGGLDECEVPSFLSKESLQVRDLFSGGAGCLHFSFNPALG